jgi:predicted nucleotidyltransferase
MAQTDEHVLSDHQMMIAEGVILEESALREHVVVYLSGAHAYGFPSPDSDLDLKAVHIVPTRALLGFETPAVTFDRAETVEGVEIDYTSNELANVLSGVLQGNGNFIERVLGRTAYKTSALHAELQPLVRGALSRRVHKHYRAFAASQLRFLERDPIVKKVLYVLRTALTGTYLLRTGEVETDVTRLLDQYGFGDARELVAAKRAGERTAADPDLLTAWRPRLASAMKGLDDAFARSALPDEPLNAAELETWLVETRRSRLK